MDQEPAARPTDQTPSAQGRRHQDSSATVQKFVVAVGIVTGALIGIFVPQDGIRPVVARWLHVDDTPRSPAPESAVESRGNVFDVTMATLDTYGVSFGRVRDQPNSYVQNIVVPAFVRERPTTSNLQASSRMSGVVRKIFVQVGQSVREGDPLMELELTGDELASAQAVLLDSVQQLEIIDDEIARLKPAAEGGGIARKNLIEKEYEQRRMKSVIESRRQELLIRGLTESEVEGIIKEQNLVRTVIIHVPTGIRPASAPDVAVQSGRNQRNFRRISRTEDPEIGPWVYSVESMMVSPGSVLHSGEPVADLAFHETLLIEGQAYERDLATLTEIINSQSPVAIEIGDNSSPVVIENLNVLYMDNHVDNETQTYRFYIEVPNEVLAENVRADERRFRTWRFKPGQRGHVRIPLKNWEDYLVLPSDAVAEEGLDYVLFRRLSVHDHVDGNMPPHCEMKKLIVTVNYKTQNTVIVDHRNQLSGMQTIAVNNADMLLRASSEGGGSHEHGHEH